MNKNRKYYEAYDERYRQVHEKSLKWFSCSPSKIVEETIQNYGITCRSKILEIGCGEGRDAINLLQNGHNVLATDISSVVIEHCKEWFLDFKDNFQVLDCLSQHLNDKFDFIYAISLLHMLVLDEDRDLFYQFLYNHLEHNGLALICTIGDGQGEWHSDIETAFDKAKRIHDASKEELWIASTSCREINFATFHKEIAKHKLELVKSGTTSILPDFPVIMYGIVKKTV